LIKIVMNNGTVYMNDPKLGWNLDRVEDIQDCLNRAGKYVLETVLEKHINIYKNDVREIIEE
jgi:uncharacterized protein YaaR (DUF327 family)